MNKTGTRKLWQTLAVIILAFAFVLSSMTLTAVYGKAASGEEQYMDYIPTSLSLSNSQFGDSSGSYPKTPTSWTGAAEGIAQAGSTVSGVVDLTASSYNENAEAYKLTQYPEYKQGSQNSVPKTPFGSNTTDTNKPNYFPGTNRNVLMINTNGSSTVFGYTSSSITFNPNSFYEIKVWVKTGDFTQDSGASIKLEGLDQEVAFTDINTVRDLKQGEGVYDLNESNQYGWQEFSFYIQSSPFKTSTVTLKLCVGNAGVHKKGTNDLTEDTTYYNPANGYAFFDNITAYQISPSRYYSMTAGWQQVDGEDNVTSIENKLAVDMGYKAKHIAGGNFELTAAETLGTYWNYVEPEIEEGTTPEYAGGATAVLYNGNAAFAADNAYNLTSDPVSPIGKTEEDNNHFLMISSYNRKNNTYADAAVGLKSNDIKIERHRYYRLSVWVKTDNVTGENGAVIKIGGTSGINDNDNKLDVKATSVTGDSEAEARYGWKEHAFYIKGSAVRDYNVHVELWLGQIGSPSKGTAMFDEIKIQEITSTEYTDNSGSGTVVEFDPTLTDTGVTNGMFYLAGDYEDYKYPLLPSGWTKQTPDTVGTAGFSDKKLDTAEDKTASGIMPTDETHYQANRANYLGAANPSDYGRGFDNVLLMAAREPTAYCYQSSALTVTANTSYKLSVTMLAQITEGYGANLVVKSGNNVVATIEQIKNNDMFRTYTFYIEGGLSDKTVTVELWLGLNDRKDNKTKLAAGNVYVSNVSFASLGETDPKFADKASAYEQNLTNGVTGYTEAAYSFKTENFTAFDAYDNNLIKTPYNWTLETPDETFVTYGIFDPTRRADSPEIPASFENKDATNANVLYLRNINSTYSKLSLNNKYSLKESSYYKLSVTLKVDIPEEDRNKKGAVGAGVSLVGYDFKFDGIVSTAETYRDSENPDVDTVIDGEVYRTYTFYISTGGSAAEVGLQISLGGEKLTEKCAGRVYVNNVTLEESNNLEYEEFVTTYDEAVADDKKNDTQSDFVKYNLNAKLSEDAADPETPEENPDDGADTNAAGQSGLQWWLIPSIIFAICIVVAIVGFAVRRGLEKKSKVKTYEKVSSYDRRATLNKTHNQTVKKTEGGEEKLVPEVSGGTEDKVYDAFDENADPDALRPVKPKAPVSPAPQPRPAEPAEKSQAPAEKPEGGESPKADETPAEAPAKAAEPQTEPQPAAPVKKDAYVDEFDD